MLKGKKELKEYYRVRIASERAGLTMFCSRAAEQKFLPFNDKKQVIDIQHNQNHAHSVFIVRKKLLLPIDDPNRAHDDVVKVQLNSSV